MKINFNLWVEDNFSKLYHLTLLCYFSDPHAIGDVRKTAQRWHMADVENYDERGRTVSGI